MTSPAADVLRGIPGSPGVAIGKAVVFGSPRETYVHRLVEPREVEIELTRYHLAVEHAQQDMREMARRVEGKSAESSILEAYVLMAGDEALAEAVRKQIVEERRCVEWAVASAIEAYASRLAAVNDPYLRER